MFFTVAPVEVETLHLQLNHDIVARHFFMKLKTKITAEKQQQHSFMFEIQ